VKAKSTLRRLVGGEVAAPDRRAQPREERVVARADRERPVGRRVGRVRRDRRVAVAQPPAHHAGQQVGRALVEQRGERGEHQRDLHALAAALGVGLAGLQRAEDGDRRVQPADEVHDGAADLQRPPVLLARHAHQPAHGLQQEVVARAVVLAEGRDRAVDDAGIARRDLLIGQPEAPHRSRPEALEQHVGAQRQPPRQLAVARLGQIQRDRALVAVEPQVVRRAALGPRRTPGAGVVAGARALDLDHLGAQVGERHRGEWAGQDP